MHRQGLRERQASVLINQEVAVGRRDVHGSRPNPVTLHRLQDFEMGPPSKDLGHQAAVAWIEMLDHVDRRDAARRLSQGDDVERRSGKPLSGFRRIEMVRLG
jgi:hypothetical protein